MTSNGDGYVPFSEMGQSRGASGADYAPARGASDAHSHPRPEMRPAPAGYGEGQAAYQQPRGSHGAQRAEASPTAMAAAQGAPVAGGEDGPNVVGLSKPYLAFGEPVHRVRLRKPIARDVKKCGYPIRPVFSDDGLTMKGYEILPDVVMKYIPLLADPPLTPATVDQLEIVDLNAFSTVINRFFQE
jgi:hypothetical protein